jgi:microcin C transport system permease protein
MSAVAPLRANTTRGAAVAPSASLSPNQRAWARFKRNRLGYVSSGPVRRAAGVEPFAELVSNDRPLIAHYERQLYFPLFHNPPEAHSAATSRRRPTGRTR